LKGEFVAIYCTGLGPVTPPVPEGVMAPVSPLSLTTNPPVVTIGEVPAEVFFSGLAPTLAGLYQINVRVPHDSPSGDAVPLVVSIDGAISNTVTVALR
jgi:uncharacterized protein (TIGR03437 family)